MEVTVSLQSDREYQCLGAYGATSGCFGRAVLFLKRRGVETAICENPLCAMMADRFLMEAAVSEED